MSSNLVPIGEYPAVAVPVQAEDGAETYVQWSESDNKNPQAVITFAILEGPHQGRRVIYFGTITSETIRRVIESLRYCGFKGDELAQSVAQKLNQRVSITVGHNEWKGKVNHRVDWVNAYGGRGVKLANPMSKDQLRMFAAKVKNQIKQVAEVSAPVAEVPAPGAATAPAEPAESTGGGWGHTSGNEPPPHDDSDLPF